jgi:hypothetical protein
MSLVSSRVALRQRCTIERDVASVDDGWGQPGPPDWQPHLEDVPCRTWVEAGREPVDLGRTATFIDRRIIVAVDIDVTERDRVAEVTERGDVVLDGPMGIEAILRRPDHLELVVERVR